jgi:hypothetical protein
LLNEGYTVLNRSRVLDNHANVEGGISNSGTLTRIETVAGPAVNELTILLKSWGNELSCL